MTKEIVDNTKITGTLNVTGAVDLDTTLNVDGVATFVSPPVVSSFASATHTHLNAAGGGVLGNAAAIAANDDASGVFGGAAVYSFPAGVKVASSQDVLNVFDEGTWTPAITGSGSNPTVTYTTQTGKYLKLNAAVIVSCTIVINTISGGSGNMLISLPVTPNSVNHILSGYTNNVDLNGAPVSLAVATTVSAATCAFYSIQDNGATSPIQISGLSAGDAILFSGIYFASS